MGGGSSIEEDTSKYNSSNYHIGGKDINQIQARTFMNDFLTTKPGSHSLSLKSDLGIAPSVDRVIFQGKIEYKGVTINVIHLNAIQDEKDKKEIC